MKRIEVKNVSKKFRDQMVLKNVNLICEDGKVYGIVGHNGSGKTVLFKCICGLLKADEGEIFVHNEKIGNTLAKNIGVIIENPAFLDNYTGKKNLELLYMLNHKKDPKMVESYIRKVGLDPFSKKKVKEYSLGMRQRLAIAQALMDEPDLIILDEPMNGLDKQGVQEIRTILLERKKAGNTILLASHNQKDIDVLCDEVYEMEEGVISKIR